MAEIIRPKATGEITQVQIINQTIFISNEIPVLVPEGDGRTFTTNYPYVINTLRVCLNGMRQKQGINYDFEELGDNRFRFNYTLDEEDELIVDYITIMQG
jgi:hypothetical protein